MGYIISLLIAMGLQLGLDFLLPNSTPRIVAICLGWVMAIIWLQLDLNISSENNEASGEDHD